jgi:dephospho-CoA kinase
MREAGVEQDRDDLPVVGITGNIGSGKSTVARVFGGLGGEVIEGDLLGRQVADESQEFQNWLRERFGEAIFPGGRLDRSALGRIVFRDEEALEELNRAIWPHIRERLVDAVEAARERGKIPVVDAAMIFEWGDQDRYDVILAVVVDPEVGARRAAERMNLSVDEVMDRYRRQIPVTEKIRRADAVLVNDESQDELRAKAAALWKRIAAGA